MPLTNGRANLANLERKWSNGGKTIDILLEVQDMVNEGTVPMAWLDFETLDLKNNPVEPG